MGTLPLGMKRLALQFERSRTWFSEVEHNKNNRSGGQEGLDVNPETTGGGLGDMR